MFASLSTASHYSNKQGSTWGIMTPEHTFYFVIGSIVAIVVLIWIFGQIKK